MVDLCRATLHFAHLRVMVRHSLQALRRGPTLSHTNALNANVDGSSTKQTVEILQSSFALVVQLANQYGFKSPRNQSSPMEFSPDTSAQQSIAHRSLRNDNYRTSLSVCSMYLAMQCWCSTEWANLSLQTTQHAHSLALPTQQQVMATLLLARSCKQYEISYHECYLMLHRPQDRPIDGKAKLVSARRTALRESSP
jgi:hypothetical protein